MPMVIILCPICATGIVRFVDRVGPTSVPILVCGGKQNEAANKACECNVQEYSEH